MEDVAEAEFPPKRLEQLDHDLQELGITLWIQRHVLDKNFNVGFDFCASHAAFFRTISTALWCTFRISNIYRMHRSEIFLLQRASYWYAPHSITQLKFFMCSPCFFQPYDLIFNHYSHLRMVAVLKMVLLRLSVFRVSSTELTFLNKYRLTDSFPALTRRLRHRQRLTEYNTPDDAVRLIRDAQNIIVLSGAGISVSCGIPDFRSRGGIYASLEGKYGLDKPEDMFDKDYFMANPSVFFDFAYVR